MIYCNRTMIYNFFGGFYMTEQNVTARKKGALEIFENIVILFFVSSFIGWIYEFFFYIIVEHRVGNSGFFFGPCLPIYGFGALLILLAVQKFKKHPALVFLCACAVTGVWEYFVGAGMYALWQRRWWDYTGLFMNIGGFVCLRSVVSFGVGAVLLVYLVEPLVIKTSERAPSGIRHLACFGTTAVFFFDAAMTIIFRVMRF